MNYEPRKLFFYYVTFSFFMSWSIWIPLYFKVFGRRSLYFIRPRLLIFINLSIGFAMGFFLCLLNFQCWKHWTLVIDLQEVMVISCIKKNHRHFFYRAKVNLARIIRFSCWLFQPGGICPSLCWSETCDMNRRGCFCEDTYKINPPDKNSTVNFTRCVDTQKSRQSSVC